MNFDERIETMGQTKKDLAKEFNECRPILSVLGDTTRQSIILCLLENIECGGMRVGELSSMIHISRTALSHHLKILKEIVCFLCRLFLDLDVVYLFLVKL